jgi:tetratricopeptide (TPR) repeat protein
LGTHNVAIQHLESFARLAEEQQDIPSQIKAYKQLGTIYNKLHNYSVSLKYFQRYYELVTEHGKSPALSELARFKIGISAGQASMDKFLKLVSLSTETSLQELLHWKAQNEWLQ